MSEKHHYHHHHHHNHNHDHDQQQQQQQQQLQQPLEDMESAEDLERQHWLDVLRSFLHYIDFFELELERRQTHLNLLPRAHSARLPEGTFQKMGALHSACSINQAFMQDMVRFHYASVFNDQYEGGRGGDMPSKRRGRPVPVSQQHRNNAVLHSLWREWSEEAAAERAESFGPILIELSRQLPVTRANVFKQRVLVPGCGVGRLPIEIAAKGYACEGNEYSAFMAIASNFILNGITKAKSYNIFPWISNLCNIVQIDHTLVGSSIPDVAGIDLLESFNIEDLPLAPPPAPNSDPNANFNPNPNSNSNLNSNEDSPFPKFSMSAGSFSEIYSDGSSDGQWDAVVTCFFIDTAPNFMEYMEVISRVLKPGGVWINLGPLLYHWVSDSEGNKDERYDKSIELSYEEIKHVIGTYGFEFETERFLECKYASCPKAMMHTVYNAVQFTCRKKG